MKSGVILKEIVARFAYVIFFFVVTFIIPRLLSELWISGTMLGDIIMMISCGPVSILRLARESMPILCTPEIQLGCYVLYALILSKPLFLMLKRLFFLILDSKGVRISFSIFISLIFVSSIVKIIAGTLFTYDADFHNDICNKIKWQMDISEVRKIIPRKAYLQWFRIPIPKLDDFYIEQFYMMYSFPAFNKGEKSEYDSYIEIIKYKSVTDPTQHNCVIVFDRDCKVVECLYNCCPNYAKIHEP